MLLLLEDAYTYQDEPAMISANILKRIRRSPKYRSSYPGRKLDQILCRAITLRYCFFTSSGVASNGNLRYSNGFNLKQDKILQRRPNSYKR